MGKFYPWYAKWKCSTFMNPKQQQQQLPYYNNNLTNTKNIVYIDI